MLALRKKLDHFLLELAWSLWTELGVAGSVRKHQNYLINPEELILLTVAMGEVDPRLRAESLDWCSQYHHFISVSRLKTIMNDFEGLVSESFSVYSATLNLIAPKAKWPVFLKVEPLKLFLSHKSSLQPLESPALLNIRARSIFSTGARADLVTFFLTHTQTDYAASDLTDIGYSKRTLAEILDEFSLSGLVEKFMVRNQNRYSLKKNHHLERLLAPLPSYAPFWRHIFVVLLTLRACIQRVEKSSESTQIVEIRTTLTALENNLQRLKITPPVFQADFYKYLEAFSEWLLGIASNIADVHTR
jgi:hypothetical protein